MNVYHRLALVYQARGEASVSKALAPLSSPLGQQPQGSQYALGRAAARAAGRASERQAAASLVHSLWFYQRDQRETQTWDVPRCCWRCCCSSVSDEIWDLVLKRRNILILSALFEMFIYTRKRNFCMRMHLTPIKLIWPLRVCDCLIVITFAQCVLAVNLCWWNRRRILNCK